MCSAFCLCLTLKNILTYLNVNVKCNYELELCADIIVSAAARRSISVGGGGAPPVQQNRRRRGAARRGRPKTVFSKIHEKISFYPQNFLRKFFSHQSFEVCR